ncbi:MAG: hypothetical protein WD276_03565 [Actinomycetota bacterium]
MKFVVFSAVILGIAVVLLPRAAKRDGLLTTRFLMFALGARLAASLLYFAVHMTVYEGTGDLFDYSERRTQIAESIRALQPEAFFDDWFHTTEYAVGLIYTVTGTTLLGAIAIWCAFAFVGTFYFYKAFRVAFPNGNARLYAWLIFFLPSILYWPSTLGKDALVLLGLGVATYGLAVLFRGELGRGAALSLAGLAVVGVIRPPAGLALAGAALAAMLGARIFRAVSRAPNWLPSMLVTVVLVAGAAGLTAMWVRTPEGLIAKQTKSTQGEPGSFHKSNFDPPNPFTPVGLPYSVVTVNFRPFPWEVESLFQAASSIEMLLVAALLIVRRREIVAGIWGWRRNNFVAVVALAWLFVSIVLAPIGNFGALARQRVQVLPFLLMLPALVKQGSKMETSSER